MRKLTKEQAEYLKLHLQKYKHSTFIEERDGILYARCLEDVHSLFDLIDECSEEEFPELELKDGAGNLIIIRRNEGTDRVRLLISDTVDSLWVPVCPEQIKLLAAGCQRIVEWLGQE